MKHGSQRIAYRVWRAARSLGLADLGRSFAGHWPFLVRVTLAGGQEMFVDLRSSIGRGLFATGSFDTAAIKPALDALTVGATFVDIGANVGYYSLLACGRVGPSGRVYCFEIDPRPLRALRKTIASSGIKTVHVQEAAVSDIDGLLTFTPEREHGHNRIDRSGKAGTAVRSVRLDTWVSEHKLDRLDVIKIDVEGAEKFVLEGARATIARFRPLILCEASDLSEPFGYRPEHVTSLLAGMNYACEWLDDVWSPTLLATPLATERSVL